MNDERKIDEAFLSEMMKRGEKAWKDVPDATAWVEELRNGTLNMTPQTESTVIDLIRERGQIGRQKYSATIDRADLTPSQWWKHHLEEMADGMQYAERNRQAALLLERARELLFNISFDYEQPYEEVEDWLNDYSKQFPSPKKHNLHSHPIKGINQPMSRIKKCDSCGAMVDIDKDSSAHGNCNQVWGRRGWRALGEYDG
jgi:hypothetical protein